MCKASRNLAEIIEFDFECKRVAIKIVVCQSFNEFGCNMIQLYDDGGWCCDIFFQGMLASYRLAYPDGFYGS